MIILGIIVAAAAIGAAVGVITESSSSASLSIFGQHVPGVHTEAQVFIVGMVIAAFAYAGLTTSWLSVARSVRFRRELHDLRAEHSESMSTMAVKNQQLKRELARARSGGGSGGGSAPATTETPVWPRQGRAEKEPDSPFFDRAE